MVQKISFDIEVNKLRRYIVMPLVTLKPKDNLIGLTFNDDGLYIAEKNANNTVLMQFDVNDDMLENYDHDLEEDEDIEIVIDVIKLLNCLDGLSGNAEFVLDIENRILKIKSNEYTYNITLKYRKEKGTYPNLDKYESSFSLSGEHYCTIIEKCYKISNLVNLTTEQDSFNGAEYILHISSKDKDSNDRINVDINSFSMNKNNIVNECSVQIDVASDQTGYIDIIKNSVKEMGDVKINIQTKYPIELEYEIEHYGIGKIAIAPRGAASK